MISTGSFSLKFLIATVLLTVLGTPVFGGPFNSEAQDGVDLYNQEEYDEALKKFEAARVSDPQDGNVLYNLANTHYKLGNFDHAVEALEAAETAFKDPTMKQKTHYNRGNAYYRKGDIEQAIQSYKKALELDPADTDSKFNLEYARKQYERAKQSGRLSPKDKKQEKKPSEGGLNPAPPEASKDSGKTPDDSDEESGSEQTEENREAQAESKPESAAGAKEKQQEAPPPGETSTDDQTMAKAMHEITSMNKDEADRWLNSLNEDLKKMSRRQVQGKMKDLFVEGGKDW